MMGGQKNAKSVPLSRSYWVIPGKLLAGYYPSSENGEQARWKITSLAEHGIRHVVNLMEEDEVNKNGRPFLPQKQSISRGRILSRSLPLPPYR